jgi:cell wall-associated NlpC family hydrolase
MWLLAWKEKGRVRRGEDASLPSPMPPARFDPRITPARPDLAAASLQGLVEAADFAEGDPVEIIEPTAPLRRAPDPSAPLETEALFGETATIFDECEGWAWVQLDRDGYVGYLPGAALGPPSSPSHRVSALSSPVYPGPSIKLPPMMALPFGARVQVERRDGDFAVVTGGRFLWARHLAEAGARAGDFVAVAERFLNAPYLWGGRTSAGIDCSGLVQTALAASGVAGPRDSDMQEAALGAAIAPDSLLNRGDLIFWKGHVGIMRDGATLIHASGWHMAVVSEPLAETRARIAAGGGGDVTSVRRLKAT